MDGYRHENKYFISSAGYQMLRSRLQAAMETDSHTVHPDGSYMIRSLYSVSYTHLDVYKRQSLGDTGHHAADTNRQRSRQIKQALKQGDIRRTAQDTDIQQHEHCLLYTSQVRKAIPPIWAAVWLSSTSGRAG